MRSGCVFGCGSVCVSEWVTLVKPVKGNSNNTCLTEIISNDSCLLSSLTKFNLNCIIFKQKLE